MRDYSTLAIRLRENEHKNETAENKMVAGQINIVGVHGYK